MVGIHRTRRRCATPPSGPLAAAALALAALGGCGDGPVAPTSAGSPSDVAGLTPGAVTAGAASAASAVLPNWHQGFNHGTDGWFDASTEGPLGWCGSITQARRNASQPGPSAGAGYALVSLGTCNAFWTNLIGIPGGGPWAPGPDLSLYSDAFPPSGFVTELDVYLDPTWSLLFGGGNLPPFPNPTIIDYSTSIRQRTGAPPTAFDIQHYYFVPVDAVEDAAALEIFGHTIDRAGWYTFRYVFRDDAGTVRVDFELDARRGGTLFTERDLQAYNLAGPFKVPVMEPLSTSEYGSGYVWLFDLAFGLELPIDEHRMRPGR